MKANALITVVITGLALHANAQVNNKKTRSVFKGYNKIIKINREWKSGDVVDRNYPYIFSHLHVTKTQSLLKHGPITYALKFAEDWKEVKMKSIQLNMVKPIIKCFKNTRNYGLITGTGK